MKIKETAKGNVQITMSKAQADSLLEMLQRMELEDYEKFTDSTDDICDLWDLLVENHHLL